MLYFQSLYLLFISRLSFSRQLLEVNIRILEYYSKIFIIIWFAFNMIWWLSRIDNTNIITEKDIKQTMRATRYNIQ